MGEKWEIELKRYNYDTHETDSLGKVNIYDIVRSMTKENFIYLLSEWVNVGMKDQRNGEEVGIAFHCEHRTLQASFFRWCLGFIVGLSKQEYTDARNETAVKSAKKIAKMLEDGELEMGWLI